MKWCLLLTLPEDYVHLAMVRRVSREVLGSFGVGAQDLDDIETLVGELTTNAVRHARNGDYTLELAISDDLAVVTVRDQGRGFFREGIADPGTARVDETDEMERFGGWGIPLVERLADRVEFLPNVPQGTTVRAEKRLKVGETVGRPG